MDKGPIEITKQALIAVEGKDLINVIHHLCADIPAFAANVDVHDYSPLGHNPINFLKTVRIATGFQRLRTVAVIRDCEENPLATVQQTQASFETADFVRPSREGTIEDGTPCSAFLCVPDGQPGAIETACVAAAIDTKALDCARCFLECLGSLKRSNAWKSKVIARGIIAASDKPAAPLGQSLSLGIWDTKHLELVRVRRFVADIAAHGAAR